MPRAYLMSWEGEPSFRWTKMYKGTRYRVGCHELPITRAQWTKEASAAAANAWWEMTLATLQANSLQLHPYADRLNELATRKEYATRHGLHEEAAILDAEIVRVRNLPFTDPNAIPDIDEDAFLHIEALRAIGIEIPDDPVLWRIINPMEAVWADRLRREKETPTERTIGALCDRWLLDRQHEARSGARSAEGADSLRRGLDKFRVFVGPSAPVETITYDVWHNWYIHCAGMVAKRDDDDKAGWSADTASKYFTISRAFVRWLWEKDILTNPPKNLASKQHKFERPDKIPPTFTNHEISRLLTAATNGHHRLILLLMLNCGMTQKDVADLRKTQIDLENGRITRRRSKTMRRKSSLLVSYKLWPEVIDLLKLHMNDNANEPRALVTKSGRPWVWTETTEAGKLRKSDNVATVFNNIKRKAGLDRKGTPRTPDKSLKIFRKTSATRLKTNKEHKELRFLFLGHKVKGVTDRHYSGDVQQHLDEAVTWLHGQYFGTQT